MIGVNLTFPVMRESDVFPYSTISPLLVHTLNQDGPGSPIVPGSPPAVPLATILVKVAISVRYSLAAPAAQYFSEGELVGFSNFSRLPSRQNRSVAARLTGPGAPSCAVV